MDHSEIVMDADDLMGFFREVFPQALRAGFVIEQVTVEGVTLTLDADEDHLRPGGTVMGPTLMMLADTAAYLCILSKVGPRALAVTTSLEMHFLKKAPPGRLVVEGRLLKLGSRLAVATVSLRSEAPDASDDDIGFATVTYSLPPR